MGKLVLQVMYGPHLKRGLTWDKVGVTMLCGIKGSFELDKSNIKIPVLDDDWVSLASRKNMII